MRPFEYLLSPVRARARAHKSALDRKVPRKALKPWRGRDGKKSMTFCLLMASKFSEAIRQPRGSRAQAHVPGGPSVDLPHNQHGGGCERLTLTCGHLRGQTSAATWRRTTTDPNKDQNQERTFSSGVSNSPNKNHHKPKPEPEPGGSLLIRSSQKNQHRPKPEPGENL